MVTLERPVPFFLDLVAFATYYPVYAPLVSQYDRLDPQTARINAEGGWTKPPHIVTNGAYVLAESVPNAHIKLVRNTQFHDAANVATLLDYFKIDHARPSWPVNRWITALVRLYKPLIVELVKVRDRTVDDWRDEHPDLATALNLLGNILYQRDDLDGRDHRREPR